MIVIGYSCISRYLDVPQNDDSNPPPRQKKTRTERASGYYITYELETGENTRLCVLWVIRTSCKHFAIFLFPIS